MRVVDTAQSPRNRAAQEPPLKRLLVLEIAQFVLEQVAQVSGRRGVVIGILTQTTVFAVADELLNGERDFAFGGIDADDFGFVRFADFDDERRIFDVIAAQFADVNEAFDALFDAGKCAKFGDLRNFAIDNRTERIAFLEFIPRIARELFDAEAEAFVGDVDVEDDGFDFIAFLVDFVRVANFLRPADIGDVDETIDAIFDADEETEIGDIADFALDDRADGVFFFEDFPRIRFGLFHAEANFLGFGIEAQDDDVDDIVDIDDAAGVFDATRPAHFAG